MAAQLIDGFASDFEDQSTESYQEPAFEAFMCPLTRQVMHDPVTIETGQTFEREAILKWFRECRDTGRKPTCPLTQRELRSTDITTSVALRNVIDEWRTRNEEKELEKACDALNNHQNQQSDQDDDALLRALLFVSHMCHRKKKNLVRKQGIIPTIAAMLKSSSRRVRLKSLEVLRLLVEDDDDNREELGRADTIRTIIKFLSNEHFQERELAVSLLYELSKCDPICERIGAVYGAVLLLVGMASSKSENTAAVDKAENTLKNLEKCETNVKQMAENGRLQPLLTKLIQGTPQVQLAMAEYLADLALANDVKVVVADRVGALLVSIIKAGGLQPAREATLKALREISSNDSSAKILLAAGILPPLVKDLFSVGAGHLPMRLKEVSAAILANLVASGASFRSIPLDETGQTTLLSEDVVHSLLHLISNTGPAIECQLLNVLVGLTGSPETVADVVAAIRSSGATISLIQFVEAAHREIRLESLKLLRNVSPYMGAELADALGGSSGHLGSLLRVVSDCGGGVTEEHAAALGMLGDLPERDWNLTRQLLDLGAFRALASKLAELRRGTIRGNRHVAPFTEGAVKVLYRVTCALQEDAEYVEFAREAGLAPLFVELLQQMSSGLDAVQLYSARALENLSLQSRRLTAVPDAPAPPSGFMCACFGGKPAAKPPAGTCRVHGGFCSLRDSFCLAEPGCKAVERLVACLDHGDARVVEAALAALSTLVGDGVENATEGVLVLGEAEGLRPMVEVLVANRTESLQRRAVSAVERILRVEDIALEVAADQSVASALVEAYRNGDARTRQTGVRARRHLDRIPNFSSAFHSSTGKQGRA